MLKNLRVRLTGLYASVAMLLVILLGAGTYLILSLYFQNANDLALKTKLISVLEDLDVPLSIELVGEKESDQVQEFDEIEDDDHEENETHHAQEIYAGELSTIFVLPLNLKGELLFNPNPFVPPMEPDQAAITSSIKEGIDFRTVILSDGTPVRLLTYMMPEQAGIELIQLGKSIADQRTILNRFLYFLLGIGWVSVILLGFGSWWIAGRSLTSHQKAWDNQQTFIANASHELRTPLTLIRASADAAKRQKNLNIKTRGFLDDVILETDHMAKLVEDLLLLTRLDSRKLVFYFSKISMSEMLENIHRQFNRIAEVDSIDFAVKAKNVDFYSDPVRLRQILIILLDNAFTHTPPGGKIQLSVAQDQRNILFTVQDTGVGIPPEHLPHVFDRFYQVKSDRGGEDHGSGLGLSIAKSLTEALNGRIELISQPGKGTRVIVSLPFTDKKAIIR